MKKRVKKLVLASETLRTLEELYPVKGGMTEDCSGARWGCEDELATRQDPCYTY